MGKTVLCYGDSNTYGYIPETGMRYPANVRYPGVLKELLGEGYTIIEEGCNGRTTIHDDPIDGWKNGLDYLRPCLYSHKPVDTVILMLGSNDLKATFGLTAQKIAQGAGVIVDVIKDFTREKQGYIPDIILVSPPQIGRGIKSSPFYGAFYEDAVEESKRFPEYYKEVADKKGCIFFDAAKFIYPSEYDSLHLTSEGHRILATKLCELIMDLYTCDKIEPSYIEHSLSGSGLEVKVIFRDETGSTNEDAVKELDRSDRPVLVIADKQNAGRGRRGRDFYSPKGTGLYMSLALKEDPVKLMKDARVTATAATAVAQAVDKVLFGGDKRALIKWVNDIYLNDRKVCGILSEAVLPSDEEEKGHIVVGIGINVYEPVDGFPADMENKAGYIIGAERGKREGLRNELAAEIIREFFYYMDKQEESLEIYRDRSCLIGSKVRINTFGENPGTAGCARVLGIDDDCGLVVEYKNGKKETLTSGEVSILKT